MSERIRESDLTRLTRLPQLPPRTPHGHKGLFGRVLIVGGSEGMVALPLLPHWLLCAPAAVWRMSRVTSAFLPFVLSVAPEAVGVPVGRSMQRFATALKACDAVAIGPGLGQTSLSIKLLQAVMKTASPVLIDADGLNLIASGKVKLKRTAAEHRSHAPSGRDVTAGEVVRRRGSA